MSIKSHLLASIAATALLTGAAHAQDYMDLARALHAEGYENQAQIRVRGDELHVEVSGSAGRTERVYDANTMVLLEEETETADGLKVEREFNLAGQLIEEEIEDDRDEDEDDRDEDEDDRDEDEDDRDEDEDERDEDEDDRDEDRGDGDDSDDDSDDGDDDDDEN